MCGVCHHSPTVTATSQLDDTLSVRYVAHNLYGIWYAVQPVQKSNVVHETLQTGSSSVAGGADEGEAAVALCIV